MSFKKALAQMKAQNARRPKPPTPPPPVESKEATVDAYRQFTHVFSHAVYRAAVGDPKGFAAFLDPQPAREDLGRAVHEALAASRFITPEHPEWDTVMRPPTADEIKARENDLKRRAGVKTNKALYNGVGSVAVTLQDGQIELSPLRHLGRGAWEGIRGHEPIRLPGSISDTELGDAVTAAIEISRNS
ncbi:contact-dependent growth inhibition system immunity protein [Psychromarinibacter sp. C21-152]|uniref:Contact-dependent growth inhibition system immunity protein n=1 Tax=Psychromarinibacter sediminicola TaxID=3033385 RepID=A0AAE3NUN7_9RHOB|nr:contact-dependent growth inhibition system immunity protein [Psychromarinibacter sediminicola]MDF0602616.1 contact-dependent growth inhibition system immunity protein [Psychromarinibacter sediminicola]